MAVHAFYCKCMMAYACTNKLVESFIIWSIFIIWPCMVDAWSLRLPTTVFKDCSGPFNLMRLKRSVESGRADVGRKPWHNHTSTGVVQLQLEKKPLHDQSGVGVVVLYSSFHWYPCCPQIGNRRVRSLHKNYWSSHHKQLKLSVRNYSSSPAAEKAQTHHSHALLLRL